MRRPAHEGRRWLRQAEYDLANARYNYEGEFYAVACFQAQQAAEKAYKAFLLSRGERVIPSHSVVELRHISEKHEKKFIDLRSTGKRIHSTHQHAIPMPCPVACPPRYMVDQTLKRR